MSLWVIALSGVPLITRGVNLSAVALDSMNESGLTFEDGDILVLAQKIVSRSEGRQVLLSEITPSAGALELGRACNKDPRLVQLVLSESSEVMRVRKDVLIVRHRLGFVLANAGIDQSNVDHAAGEAALLLPVDPDASCRRLRASIAESTGCRIGVVIIDSFGRAWRHGTVGTAIGVAGVPALLDLRGRLDLHGRALRTSELGFADELAAAASLVMGQAGEGTPMVLVRGAPKLWSDEARAGDLVRSADSDLFT